MLNENTAGYLTSLSTKPIFDLVEANLSRHQQLKPVPTARVEYPAGHMRSKSTWSDLQTS